MVARFLFCGKEVNSIGPHTGNTDFPCQTPVKGHSTIHQANPIPRSPSHSSSPVCSSLFTCSHRSTHKWTTATNLSTGRGPPPQYKKVCISCPLSSPLPLLSFPILTTFSRSHTPPFNCFYHFIILPTLPSSLASAEPCLIATSRTPHLSATIRPSTSTQTQTHTYHTLLQHAGPHTIPLLNAIPSQECSRKGYNTAYRR